MWRTPLGAFGKRLRLYPLSAGFNKRAERFASPNSHGPSLLKLVIFSLAVTY